MNIFKRLIKIGQAEIHSLVEKMENPISLIEQGIRDLREELAQTEEQFAQVRAITIRTENIINEKLSQADDYEQKTRLILEKAKKGDIAIEKADALAYEALNNKKIIYEDVEKLRQEVSINNIKIKEINNKLNTFRDNILKWEKELVTIKTKQKITSASLYANQQMSKIEHNSTIEMLERLKNKTKDSEALAEAYAELSKQKTDTEINTILNDKDDVKKELELLKHNLGLD